MRTALRSLAAGSLALAVTTRAAVAQTEHPIRFEALAGMNVADLVYPGGVTQRRTAFVGGLGIVKPLRENWSFQPEITYSMKGGSVTDGMTTLTRKLSYLELPLLARYDVESEIAALPFLHIGPAVALRLACGVDTRGAVAGAASCASGAAGGEAHALELGAMGGAGVAFKRGGHRLSAELRLTLGLTNVYVDEPMKSRVWSVVAAADWP